MTWLPASCLHLLLLLWFSFQSIAHWCRFVLSMAMLNKDELLKHCAGAVYYQHDSTAARCTLLGCCGAVTTHALVLMPWCLRFN